MKLTKKMLLDIKEVHGHDIENITWVVNTLIAEVERLQAVEAAARSLRTGPTFRGGWESVNANDYENLMATLEDGDE